MNTFVSKRNLYEVSEDLFDITKGLEHLGYNNDDAGAEAALKTYLDYEDIYDNLDDYEYPYNHINKGEL